MEVAAAKLKDGGDNSAEEIEELSGSSSKDSTSADLGEDGVENNWIDESDEDEAALSQPKKLKRKRKVFSCVEKVCKVQPFAVELYLLLCYTAPCRCGQYPQVRSEKEENATPDLKTLCSQKLPSRPHL